jgi:hypothetical protein
MMRLGVATTFATWYPCDDIAKTTELKDNNIQQINAAQAQ